MKEGDFMVGSLVKLALSVLFGAVGIWQHTLGKSVAQAFCFILCGLLFLAFLIDVVLSVKQKKLKFKDSVQSPPAGADDLSCSPELSDLKIGTIYRAQDADLFRENIRSFARTNPDYTLSESEIIDRYLTDKKLWKYVFRPLKAKVSSVSGAQKEALGIYIDGKQVGTLSPADSDHLLPAMHRKGLEVVYCTLGGGPYKAVALDVSTGKDSLTEAETPYSVTLSICEN